MTPAEPEDTPTSRQSALDKLERQIKAEVGQARAIEPLLDEAKTVPRQLRSRLKKALPLIALLSIGLVLISTGLYDQLKLDNLASRHAMMVGWVALHPLLSALTLAGAIALIVSTGLPGGAALVVFGGLLFGTVEAALLAVTGDTIGATVLYFAARNFFMSSDAKPPALVERIRGGFQASPISFAFFLRLVPVFPYGAMSVAMAWLGCSYRLFFVSSSLGALPSSTVYAALGAGLAHAIDSQEKVSMSILTQPRFAIPLVALAVLALLPALLGLKRRR